MVTIEATYRHCTLVHTRDNLSSKSEYDLLQFALMYQRDGRLDVVHPLERRTSEGAVRWRGKQARAETQGVASVKRD